jgi:hypothetical protein
MAWCFTSIACNIGEGEVNVSTLGVASRAPADVGVNLANKDKVSVKLYLSFISNTGIYILKLLYILNIMINRMLLQVMFNHHHMNNKLQHIGHFVSSSGVM